VSLLDDRDLLALRLVSRKMRVWVDAVLPSHPTKSLTLYVNYNEKNTAVDELVEDEIPHGIPFFRRLNVGNSSFFSHPLLPDFLRIYGSQIQTVSGPYYVVGGVDPKEVAFFETLPNLTQLSARWLGDNVPAVKMPALERLKLHTLRSVFSDLTAKINFHFLQNFSNLTHLWLPKISLNGYVEVLIALRPYFAIRNGLEGSSRRTLTISLRSYGDFPDELSPSEKEDVVTLLQELAVADGRILLENMPIMLLDEAVRLFHHQRGGQLLLTSFGKCIRSLIGLSSSLYEVELPNLLKWKARWNMEGTTARDGDYSRTVSWPKLEEVKLKMNECLAKLVFGSGVFRPSVKRLECNLHFLTLFSEEAHLLLANFPNVTHLTLNVKAEEVGLFRSVMRVLPTSCPKIQLLFVDSYLPLGDEDLLGVDGKEGHKLATPPLLQLRGK
jgi:hypothetical protein